MATEYKTLHIGTIFTYNGNEYKVCEDNNINLLRIPYWEFNNIENIICQEIEKLKTFND